MIELSVIQNELKSIIGEKLQYVRRSCDLIDVGIGELFPKKSRTGEIIKVAKFAINSQCSFRIISKDNIEVGSDDLLFSIDYEENNNLSFNKTTVFDRRTSGLLKMFDNEYVSNIKVNKYGDLTIYLTNIQIELFVNCSGENEAWRFFEVNSGQNHLVIRGEGAHME